MGLGSGVVVVGEFVEEANAVRLDFNLVMVGEYLGIHWSTYLRILIELRKRELRTVSRSRYMRELSDKVLHGYDL